MTKFDTIICIVVTRTPHLLCINHKAAEHRRGVHNALAAQARKMRPSWFVTRRATSSVRKRQRFRVAKLERS